MARCAIDNMLRWLLGLRKLRSSKMVEILKFIIVLRVGSWKNVFLSWRKGTFFFTKKSSSTALSYLNAHLTLNFAKEQDLDFIRSSHLFWEQPQRGILEVNCQAGNFTGVIEDFAHIRTVHRSQVQTVLKNLIKF